MFKVGDVVKLKSGGPFMTVEKATKDEVEAVYFNENRELLVAGPLSAKLLTKVVK